MTPEQAAEARKRKKEHLERQLAALDEEDRYYARASQPPDISRQRDHTYPGSMSQPSRSDVISPPWPQTATSTTSTDWRSAPSSSGHSRNRTAPSAFQPLPEPTPMNTGSSTASSSQAPWQRTGIPSSSSSARPNDMYTPSPDLQGHHPRMPNPFSASFVNIPVPSKEQVDVYLIRTQNQPLGLRTGWTISNHLFDVYDLFVAVIRLGGTKAVSRRQWWPEMADTLGIPGVNSPQGRNVVESGRQLYTFFTTHLGPLEDMWEQTSGTAEDAGLAQASAIDAQSRSHLPRMRQPVSAARGGHEDGLSHSWTRTYPPQPPAPVISTSNRQSGSSKQRQPSGTGSSSTVPLHVNPVDISTRRTADTHHTGTSNDYARQYPYDMSPQTATSQHTHQYTHGQTHAPSVSPVIHHPVPAALSQPQRASDHLDQYGSGSTSANITPSLPAAVLPTSSSRSQPAPKTATSGGDVTGQPQPATNGKSKPFTFPSLTNYNPPKFASFDHLVQTNALTLPKLPPNVHLDYVGTPSEIYAKRCFELRSVVKKIQSKEPARHISVDEMTFWQKLLAILRHNPQVIIPGHQPMSTENAPLAPTQSTSNAAGTSGPAAGQGQGTDQAPPKKRRRSKKDTADGDAESSQPKKRGRPRKERTLDNAPTQSTSTAALPPTSASDAPAFAIDPRLLVLEAAQPLPIASEAANASSLNGETQSDPRARAEADVPPSTIDDSQSDQSKKARKPWTTRVNADGTPVARKPYTIKRNPDGTPVAERFRRGLSSGKPQRRSYVSPPPEGQQAIAGPSNSQAISSGASHDQDDRLADLLRSLGDADADGEIDHDAAPKGLQEALELAKQAQAQLARVLAAHQPSQQSSASQGDAGSTENPKRVDSARQAAVRRWDRVRQEREALGLPTTSLTGQRAPSTSVTAAASFTANPPVRAPAHPASAVSTANGHTPAPVKRGGFSVPGAASHAAHKRWSLSNATAYASGSGRQSTPADLAYIDAVRAGSVKPFASSSPRKVVSLSASQTTPGGSSQSTDTPSRRVAVAQSRAEITRPRSSLPLYLTPAPRRSFARAPSEDDHEDVIDLAEPLDDDYHDEDEEEEPKPRVTRGSATRANDKPSLNTRSRPKARASLPATLSRAPSSKGKGVARRGSVVDPSPKSVLTRNAMARGDTPIATRSSASQPSSSTRVTRGSSAVPGRPTRTRQVIDLTTPATRPRRSLPSTFTQPTSSQGRARLVPEVELPKSSSVSPVKLNPRPRPRSTAVVETKPRIVPKPKPKPKPKAVPKSRPAATPSPARPVIKEPRVVLRINKRRRQELIDCGAYDVFNDDDSDEEEVLQRQGHPGLRKIALSKTSSGRTARPTSPEPIPVRFFSRGGPALLEPFKSILDESTILKRACAHECQWKGCDSVLASEWHLRQHFELKRHAEQGAFKAGMYGQDTLYRCHWVECEKPCFTSLAALEQHLTARHISRTLACPWPDCDLRFSTLPHLTRHALRHHDSPDDHPRPLADTTERSRAPSVPLETLPTEIRADTLIMPTVHGSTYPSVYKREWCKLKVHNGSMAPLVPSLVPHRQPHILEVVGEDADDDVSDSVSLYTTLDGGPVTEERLLDVALGRPKRRLYPVVDIRVRKLANAGWYQDPSSAAKPQGDEDVIVIDDGPDAPEASASPRRRARFDLSESVHDDETRGSESEVWAELEEDLAETAFTPAGFPADFDLDLLDDDAANEAGPSQYEADEADFDALVNETFSTPAAYLGVDPDDEEQGRQAGEGSGSSQQVDEPMDIDELPIWDGQLETMPKGLLGPSTEGEARAPLDDATGDEEPVITQGETTTSMDVDNPIEPEVDDTAPPGDQTPTVGGAASDVPITETATEPTSSRPTEQPDAAPEPVDKAITVGETVDSTVPDFSGLFGKSPPVTEKPLHDNTIVLIETADVAVDAEKHSGSDLNGDTVAPTEIIAANEAAVPDVVPEIDKSTAIAVTANATIDDDREPSTAEANALPTENGDIAVPAFSEETGDLEKPSGPLQDDDESTTLDAPAVEDTPAEKATDGDLDETPAVSESVLETAVISETTTVDGADVQKESTTVVVDVDTEGADAPQATGGEEEPGSEEAVAADS